MDQLFEHQKRLRLAEHPLRQRASDDAFRPGRAGESPLDLGDQRPLRPLQPVDRGVGVEHRHALIGEQASGGRLAHADRSGEAEPDHRTRSSRSSGESGSSQPTSKK
jgi:hypothetical protein